MNTIFKYNLTIFLQNLKKIKNKPTQTNTNNILFFSIKHKLTRIIQTKFPSLTKKFNASAQYKSTLSAYKCVLEI